MPEMDAHFLTPRNGGHRGDEGAGEARIFSNIPEEDTDIGLLYIIINSPAPINLISVKNAPKKCHMINTLNSKDDSESKSDSEELDFEYKKFLRISCFISLTFHFL